MIRLFNRVVSLVLGIALVAAGVLVIIEGIWTWTNSGFLWIPGHAWLSSFKTTEWSAPIVIAVSAGVALIGLVVLVLEVRPHRRRVVPYRTDTAGQWELLRRSTETHLQRRLAGRVPVKPITVRLTPRGRWSLKVKARSAASTRPALEAAGKAELGVLHAPGRARVRVKTTGATT